MKSKTLLVISWCLLGTMLAMAQGQGGGAAAQAPPADTFAPDIPGVVAAGTKVQLLKEGFQGAQGATAAQDGSLIFTERMANRITKLDKDGNFSTYLENTNATNSMMFDPKGRAIGVEWVMPSQLAVLAPTPSVLADKYDGHGFGQLNDLAMDKKGGVYVTDDRGTPAENIKPGVFYVKPNGDVIKIADDFTFPNGVILSPDEKTLYVVDTQGDTIWALDVQADGSANNEHAFAKMTDGVRKTPDGKMAGGADGITIDGAGRLYVCANSGIQVYSPQGMYLGSIPTPRKSNAIAFAGADKKTLYVLAGNAVYQIPMIAAGYKGRLK